MNLEAERLRMYRTFTVHAFDDDFINETVAKMLFLQSEDAHAPIHLRVDSPGGKVFAAFALMDTMAFVTNPVYTYAGPRAHGIAVSVVAHGHRGCRFALPTSRFSLVPLTSQGSADMAKHFVATRARILSELERDTGQSSDYWEDLMTRGSYFDARQAQSLGVIDAIMDSPWNDGLRRS